jgi:hypothetical protein
MTSPAALWAPVRGVSPASSGWFPYFDQHRDLPMPAQVREWTCSACAIDWVLRATGLDPDSTREQVVGQLGYPSCIDENWGLKDTQCAVHVFEQYVGVGNVIQEWVSWPRALELCDQTTGLLNSTVWQHFVAIRGVQGQDLWIANSAPGYRGIYDTISYAQFAAWGGSWQIVHLIPN